MRKPEVKALAGKIALFSALGVLFWALAPDAGLSTYAVFVLLASAWAIYETLDRKKRGFLKYALLLGVFLMVFDFVVENLGFFTGFWTSPHSVMSVISVPIEIMALTFISGYAWAMHLPQKVDKWYVIAETLIFGFFGALGEQLLILNGMMVYMNGWTYVHAFLGYAGTWLVLFGVWYKVIRKFNI